MSILLQEHNSPYVPVSSVYEYIIQLNYTPYNVLTSNILYSWIYFNYYLIREFQTKIMTFNGGMISTHCNRISVLVLITLKMVT
jgi:hypothetical protein